MPAGRRSKSRSEPTEPVNLVDGIPDRSPRPAKWAYVVIGVVFVAWVAALVYCRMAGSAQQ